MQKGINVFRFQPKVFGFPDRLLTTLRYNDVYAITSTSGSTATQIFRWNSIYDPDYTSAGHQPLYRDTFASIYDHYAVVKARVHIRYTNNSASTVMLLTCNTEDDASASGSFTTQSEMSRGWVDLVQPLAGSHSSGVKNFSWDCKQVLGIDPYSSEEYKTAIASNPTEESFFILSASGYSASTGTIIAEITFEYDVLFTELATPSGS
jgi:hypothetical protein